MVSHPFACVSVNKEVIPHILVLGPRGVSFERLGGVCSPGGRTPCVSGLSGEAPARPSAYGWLLPLRTSSAPSAGMSSLCRASWPSTWRSTARSWPEAALTPARPAGRSSRRPHSSRSTWRHTTRSGGKPFRAKENYTLYEKLAYCFRNRSRATWECGAGMAFITCGPCRVCSRTDKVKNETSDWG